MDGILNINKPLGVTSFDVVARVKRLIGERRVGHAGTLDPQAEGVLPVCFGRATRVIEFLAEATKSYRGEIELGITTDTYDAAGTIISRKDPSGISQSDLLRTLDSFKGIIEQVPPMYSALKKNGLPLYKLARAGIEVERRPRRANIHSLDLIDWHSPVAAIEVVCGKGTYIRSLAHDLGQRLGCGAHLKSLVRLSYGPFNVKEAISIELLTGAATQGYWWHFIHPLDSVLTDRAAMVLGEGKSREVTSGQPLVWKNPSPAQHHCRAYSVDGCFLGILRFSPENGQWLAEKILTDLYTCPPVNNPDR